MRLRHDRSILPALAIALLCAALCTVPGLAQERGDDSGRASKNGLAEGQAGGADVSITYGRPKVKDRAIWGALVPYGRVWRAGADEATTITFSKDVTVDGTAVAAGTYSLFLVPTEEEWTFVLNEVANQWGAFNYDQSKDVARVSVQPMKAEHAEELTFTVADDMVWLHWEGMKGGFEVSGS